MRPAPLRTRFPSPQARVEALAEERCGKHALFRVGASAYSTVTSTSHTELLCIYALYSQVERNSPVALCAQPRALTPL